MIARSPASFSTVEPGRGCSSVSMTRSSAFRCGTETGTISSSNSPSLAPLAARWCDSAAKASWASRLMFSDAAYFSVPAPMAHWSKAQNNPSWATESTRVASP